MPPPCFSVIDVDGEAVAAVKAVIIIIIIAIVTNIDVVISLCDKSLPSTRRVVAGNECIARGGRRRRRRRVSSMRDLDESMGQSPDKG